MILLSKKMVNSFEKKTGTIWNIENVDGQIHFNCKNLVDFQQTYSSTPLQRAQEWLKSAYNRQKIMVFLGDIF